ncbi:protein of unknown function [Thiomonas sp. Bio17B3]|nr:protein of unknown function [Thiomonas sp. Bio17B3]VDY08402.1 protein of unknown function [Thiomonas sp. Sup16B3]VDY12678.1 protein of unknown function [Thiomonas sp. OC7]VDY18112.1 protein of unknown function [Thiomonas sp. CB2]
MSPHAHCVRCPPRGRRSPSGGRAGCGGPPRSLRSLPPEGAAQPFGRPGGLRALVRLTETPIE